MSDIHFHTDEAGALRRCYHKCTSLLKITAVFLLLDVVSELITFLPIHHLFEHLGWIH